MAVISLTGPLKLGIRMTNRSNLSVDAKLDQQPAIGDNVLISLISLPGFVGTLVKALAFEYLGR